MTALVAVVLALATTSLTLATAMKNGVFPGYGWAVPYLIAISIALYILALFLAVLHFRRERKKDTAVPPPPLPIQENTQTLSQQFNPQFNPQIHIGVSAPKTPELDEDAITVIGFMKRVRPMGFHDAKDIATALNLTNKRTWDALVILESAGKVRRSSIDQAFNGALWILDELEHVAIPAQAISKPVPNIKCIETRNVAASCLDGCFHQVSPGDVMVSLACFRNDPIAGQTTVAEPEPSLRAHVIYRDSSGNEITDLPMGVWLDQISEIAKFRLGDKKCLILLLFNPHTKKRMKVWNDPQHAFGTSFARICDEELPSSIASVEVRLFAVYQGTCPVHVLLIAENREDELPSFKVQPISLEGN